MELKPGIGIDTITFGMTQKDVILILGEPDLIWNMDTINGIETILRWNTQKLDLSFFKNKNNQLSSVQTIYPELNYNGNKIIGVKIERVKEQVFGDLIPNWKTSPIDDFEFVIAHYNDEHGFCLEVEYGVVINFEMNLI